MEKRVEIHGTSRADMNGKRGVAIDFHPMGGPDDPATWRYTVQLDGGEAFKLKMANLRWTSRDKEVVVQGGKRRQSHIEESYGPRTFVSHLCHIPEVADEYYCSK